MASHWSTPIPIGGIGQKMGNRYPQTLVSVGVWSLDSAGSFPGLEPTSSIRTIAGVDAVCGRFAGALTFQLTSDALGWPASAKSELQGRNIRPDGEAPEGGER